MARPFPYTYYSCPCIDPSAPSATLPSARRVVSGPPRPGSPKKTLRPIVPPPNTLAEDDDSDDDGERTFDPHAQRAQYSLFPLEHLLYCTECHQIRCARCIAEEVVCWYCPSCLFEVPSSTVRSEGNRYVPCSLGGLAADFLPLLFEACTMLLSPISIPQQAGTKGR